MNDDFLRALFQIIQKSSLNDFFSLVHPSNVTTDAGLAKNRTENGNTESLRFPLDAVPRLPESQQTVVQATLRTQAATGHLKS